MLLKKILLFCSIICTSTASITHAQELGPEHYDEEGNLIADRKKTGFFTGIYVGSYFPNSNSASLYDGYGFNYDENRNSFEDSWMNQKINKQYGSDDQGHPDYIAQALGVQSTADWNFDESDMPTNMRYKTAVAVGLTGRYTLDPKNAILFNINGSILKAAGSFTISTVPPSGSTQINNSIQTFNISGEEQRLLFEAGYQHLFGNSETMNFFLEGGLHATLAQFISNEIKINDLYINLYDDYYNSNNNYTFDTGAKPVGLGFGAFAGGGLNIDTQSRWAVQLVYNLLLENIRIGYDQKITPSQMVGLRAYFYLSKK